MRVDLLTAPILLSRHLKSEACMSLVKEKEMRGPPSCSRRGVRKTVDASEKIFIWNRIWLQLIDTGVVEQLGFNPARWVLLVGISPRLPQILD